MLQKPQQAFFLRTLLASVTEVEVEGLVGSLLLLE